MRLTEITAQCFRSLYSVTLPLKPLNIIAGPNGSGKSNLIRLLRFVRDIATDPQASLQYRGVARELVWYGQEEGRRVDHFNVALRFTDLREPCRTLEYVVDVGAAGGELTFGREVLADPSASDNVYLSRTERRAEIWEKEEDGKRPPVFTIAPHILALQYLSPLTDSPAVQSAQRSIGGWRFPAIDTAEVRKSTLTTMRPERVPELSSDAGNLSEFLYALQADRPDDLAEIVERLCNAIEFLEDVKVEAHPSLLGTGAEVRYQLFERAFADAITPDSASDGTLRLLALLALLLGDRSPSLVCLEEPNHNLHPHLMLHLADAMRYVAGSKEPRPQLIVTTHSPDFLDCFRPESEADYLNVFVAHKDPQTGKTDLRLVDSAQLAHRLAGTVFADQVKHRYATPGHETNY